MTRRVVVHVDDLGMSHGANRAFVELSALGTVTSGSVMVPCPWFPELAAMARADTSLDVGVHLTLTSEAAGYRWRPLTRPPASAGLTDALGFFHPDIPTLRAQAQPEAVEAELRAQIEMATEAGIDVTHLDDHMGAVLAPEFVAVYVRVARDYRLPLLMCPTLATYGGPHNMIGITEEAFAPGVAAARAAGFTIFDRIVETEWTIADDPVKRCRGMFEGLLPGLSFLAIHPTAPGEIEAIDPAFHAVRSNEYAVLRSSNHHEWIAAQRLSLSDMRSLREDFRGRTAMRM